MPWGVFFVALCCSLLGGAIGAGSVLFVQSLQAEEAPAPPEQDIFYIMQGVRENAVIETVKVDTGKLMTPAEAAVNFGIGEKKLRSMMEDYRHLGLFIQNGVQYMIKRQKFEAFLDGASAI